MPCVSDGIKVDTIPGPPCTRPGDVERARSYLPVVCQCNEAGLFVRHQVSVRPSKCPSAQASSPEASACPHRRALRGCPLPELHAGLFETNMTAMLVASGLHLVCNRGINWFRN